MKNPMYIDLTTDYAFKRIFASEVNKDLLINFINEVFRGRKKIIDLFYNRNEYVGDNEELGSVILDLSCTAEDGSKIILEVQTSPQLNFKRRILYYGGTRYV
jgi:predicted transposase/invertase (TIGR01784 family)